MARRNFYVSTASRLDLQRDLAAKELLIADLLEALKAVRDDVGLNDLIAGIGEKPDFWDQLNAAIAKAQGGGQ